MDKDQPEERRHERRIPPKRVWLANSLSANYLRLGAGVSFSLISWSLLSGFAAAAEGPHGGAPATLHPVSEIRLKPIGSTISLTPIGNTSRAISNAASSQPHPSRIQPNPMTGDSLETLDQPIFAGSHTENINAIAAQSGTKHPRILSIRRLDLPPPIETSVHVAGDTESIAADPQREHMPTTNLVGDLPPSILVESLGEETEPDANPAIAFSLSDTASIATTDIDDVASLPLLPLPTNRQWVAAIATGSGAEKRAEQRAGSRVDNRIPTAKIPIPQTISAAQVNRLSTTHAGLSVRHGRATVPARPSGFVKPAQATQPPPIKDRAPSDSVALMMKETQHRYPNAHVVLANKDGRVVVRGNCHDRKEATAIIRLIRSQLLIPVDDQLVIR